MRSAVAVSYNVPNVWNRSEGSKEWVEFDDFHLRSNVDGLVLVAVGKNNQPLDSSYTLVKWTWGHACRTLHPLVIALVAVPEMLLVIGHAFIPAISRYNSIALSLDVVTDGVSSYLILLCRSLICDEEVHHMVENQRVLRLCSFGVLVPIAVLHVPCSLQTAIQQVTVLRCQMRSLAGMFQANGVLDNENAAKMAAYDGLNGRWSWGKRMSCSGCIDADQWLRGLWPATNWHECVFPEVLEN